VRGIGRLEKLGHEKKANPAKKQVSGKKKGSGGKRHSEKSKAPQMGKKTARRGGSGPVIGEGDKKGNRHETQTLTKKSPEMLGNTQESCDGPKEKRSRLERGDSCVARRQKLISPPFALGAGKGGLNEPGEPSGKSSRTRKEP